VSHDRYFLDRIVQRMFVLQPPTMVDFAGNYSKWHARVAADTRVADAKAQAKSTKRESAPRQQAAQSKRKNTDNPYLRPFGKLSLQELEREITNTEVAIAECQSSFGDTDSFKEASRGQQLQSEYKRLSQKLEQLEAEYYNRGS